MIDTLKPLIKQFLPYAKEKMGFERPPSLFLKQDASNASNPLGKTAFYDPAVQSITLFITDRHPKDVMRSLSHELVHHTQNCNGQLDNPGEMGEGYAQNNEHMREMEREAYEMGNMCFRDWEDSIKGTIYNESLQKGVKENMSTKNWKDKELNTLLLEKWGFKFDPDGLTERRTGSGVYHTQSDPETEEEAGEAETRGTAKSKRGIKEEESDLEESWADDDAGGYQRKYEKERGIRKKGYSSPPDPKKKKKKEEEEDLDEAFENPKSATGAGPTNKGGKIDRSDVANKDTSKFGQGGSKGGGKESAGGTNAPPQAGKMDRTDVANKASGRWLKEDVELHVYVEAMTKCKQQHTIAGDSIVRECIEEEMTRRMNEGFGEGRPADDEWSKKQEIYMEEDEEELDERHKPDNVRQGREPGRRKKNIKTGQRTVDESNASLTKEQKRRIVKKILQNFKESKR